MFVVAAISSVAAIVFAGLWWNERGRHREQAKDRDFWHRMYQKQCEHTQRIIDEALKAIG